ncbi:MAG: RNA polymerase-binding protein DksA [Woeseiaceae bacterium]
MSRKKVSTRKRSKKKTKARKKPAAKKARGRKKVSRKKPASRKKKTSKKKATKKKLAKKRTVKKKPAARKTAKKKAAAKNTPSRTTAARRRRRRHDLLSGPIHGIAPYSAKRGEEYMSPDQLGHFGAILTSWKRELMDEVDRTVHHMQDEAANFPDPNDRATQESEFGLELRTRDRERKLLRKIDEALARIDDGSYGFCDETGEEIGLKRLEARPVATLCLEAQERREMAERQFRDRDDRYR